MGKSDIETLNVLVAGDTSSGKENFIKRFLSYYPSSAEILRKNAALHVIHNLDKSFKIQLHDVHDLKTMDSKFNDMDMDVVFFCYSANDHESFQNLEKWIQLLQVHVKESLTFLVADMSQVSRQEAKLLAEHSVLMKERFGINHFIESSFDIKDSAFSAFLTILNKASEFDEELSLREFYYEHTQKILETCLEEILPGVSRQIRDMNLDSYCRKEETSLRDTMPCKLLQLV